MIEYRITKYDPAYRNATGAFQRDDWTSFSDIGSVHNGEVVTAEAYERAEGAYVATALSIWREAGRPPLEVNGLEGPREGGRAPREGEVVPEPELESLIRRILREELWCRLEGPSCFIHFGWDYYMYVGAPHPCPSSITVASERGLFVEEFTSPYHPRSDSLVGDEPP